MNRKNSADSPQERFMKVFNLNSILKEDLDPEKNELVTGFDVPELKKVKTKLQVSDPKSLSTSPIYIGLPLYFNVKFNSPQILEDYGILSGYEEEPIEAPTDSSTEPVEAEPTDADITGIDNTPATTGEKVKKYKIDYNAFYSIVKKKLSNTAIQYKINDQVRAGVFKLGNFEINSVLYIEKQGFSSSVKQLYEKFVLSDKKTQSKNEVVLQYGIEFDLVQKDSSKMETDAIIKFIKAFAIEFEKYILIDDDYISYVQPGQQALKRNDPVSQQQEVPQQ